MFYCNYLTTLLPCRDDLRHYLPPSKPVLAHQIYTQLTTFIWLCHCLWRIFPNELCFAQMYMWWTRGKSNPCPKNLHIASWSLKTYIHYSYLSYEFQKLYQMMPKSYTFTLHFRSLVQFKSDKIRLIKHHST